MIVTAGNKVFQTGDVVQFNERHKWMGCFGAVTEVKRLGSGMIRYMVGVAVPEKGIAYIFVTSEEDALEYIGKAVLVEAPEDDD